MKILTLLPLLLIGCHEPKDVQPTTEQLVCVTGIPKGGTDRVKVRCCTKDEALAGNNMRAGGVSYFNNYTDHEITPVNNCNECQ